MSRYTLGTIRATEEQEKQVYDNCNVLKDVPYLTEKSYMVAYGFDHACGYFIQFFEENDTDVESVDNNLDYDSLFSGLTGVELGYFLGLFGGNPDHILQAMLDLPF